MSVETTGPTDDRAELVEPADPAVRRRRGVVVAVLVVAVLVVLVGAAGVIRLAGRSDDEAGPGPAVAEPLGLTIRSSDGVVTRPDGSTVDTGVRDGLVEAVVLTDGRVVAQAPGGGGAQEVRVYDAEGALAATYDSGPEVLHGSGTSVAWTMGDGRLGVLRSGGFEPLPIAAPPKLEGDAPRVGYEIATVDCGRPGTECSVVLRYDHERGQLLPGIEQDVFLRVTADGWKALASEPLQGVLDTSPDGGTRLVTLPDGCVGLRDGDTASITASTCDRDLAAPEFSPDGSLLVSVGADGVVVMDRELAPVRTIAFPRGIVHLEHGWTNAGSLLMVVMVEEPVVPGRDPSGDRPGGLHDWYLVDVPVDGERAAVVEGPVRGPHHDTNRWVWRVSDDAEG